jgi:tetratricopeptide (TPR) repeat protein
MSSDDVRAHIREWMAGYHVNQSRLAQQAGLNRSIVSRFLEKGQPLSPESASRLFRVFTANAEVAERFVWLERLGLDGMAESLGLLPMEDTVPSISGGTYASGDLQEGYHLLNLSIIAGLDLLAANRYLEQAEKAFHNSPNMAATAAILQAQNWLDLGDTDRARQAVVRIETTYLHSIDPITRLRFKLAHGQLEYVCSNYSAAVKIFTDLAHNEIGNNSVSMAKHFLGLSLLALGETSTTPADAKRWLKMAERFLLASLQERLMLHPVADDVAFEHLRLSQIYRKENRTEEAEYHLKQARTVCACDEPRLYVELELADLALEAGKTKAARTRATRCLERWSTLFKSSGYPMGMAFSLVVIAFSYVVDNRLRRSLAAAITAAALAPAGLHYKGEKLAHLPGLFAGDLFRQVDGRSYKRYVAALQEDLVSHYGYFAYLKSVTPDRTSAALQILQSLG